ncbi:MAG: class I SAM-dependent methyltransferase [Archangium sp.]
MTPLLYGDLTGWYSLLDPRDDHEGEVTAYVNALLRGIDGEKKSLLDLGAGAGNNAWFLKQQFACTLTDISDAMLTLSRTQNPECEHLLGDMRTLRLNREFDAVLVHDAVCYMTTREDLTKAAQTAFIYLRDGGAAVFAPDCTRESFQEGSSLLECDEGGRSLHGIEWSWDADANDETYQVEYALLLRDGVEVRAVHDRHTEGLFTRATWLEVLRSVGFEVETFQRPADDEGAFDEVFLCRKPRR